MTDIERRYQRVTVTIPINTAQPTTPFDMRMFAGGFIEMPAAWTAADICFKVSTQETDTPQPLYDENGTLLRIDGPTANNRYVIPDKVFAAHYVWLWSEDGAAGDENQLAERELVVALKG